MNALASIDWAALEAFLDAQGVGAGGVEDVEALTGGSQNLLLKFRRGREHLVLRRPPEKPRPGSNAILAREARVLGALAGSRVAHARLRAFCADSAIIGASFLVTDFAQGFNAAAGLPAPIAADPNRRFHMGVSLVEALAELARFDWREAGLDDFGKLDGFLERQVDRWNAHYGGYRETKAWDGADDLAGLERIGAWLKVHMPNRMQAGLMHGDYHIGNVLFDESGAVSSILDWEMSTLGDPLLDFGRLLASWPDERGNTPLSVKVTPWSGFPTREDLIARYSEIGARDLDDLVWFEALACYKLAIILEGTNVRAAAGLAPPETGARLHASATALVARALERIH